MLVIEQVPVRGTVCKIIDAKNNAATKTLKLVPFYFFFKLALYSRKIGSCGLLWTLIYVYSCCEASLHVLIPVTN